jgi:hypothetical protein
VDRPTARLRSNHEFSCGRCIRSTRRGRLFAFGIFRRASILVQPVHGRIVTTSIAVESQRHQRDADYCRHESGEYGSDGSMQAEIGKCAQAPHHAVSEGEDAGTHAREDDDPTHNSPACRHAPVKHLRIEKVAFIHLGTVSKDKYLARSQVAKNDEGLELWCLW